MHSGLFLGARTGSTKHPSLISDPIPKFIYKRMERRWALAFAGGSVKIGSLFYYRSIPDPSGMVVDPHEGLEVFEVTEEMLRTSPMLGIITGGQPPAAGKRLGNEDNRRLVFCASASTSIPPDGLPAEYDTWLQIEAAPAIELIHQALLQLVPDVEGPVFKKVIYDSAIDGPDDSPPLRPMFEAVNNALQLSSRWYTKRTKFQAQAEVRVGWLAAPTVCISPFAPLTVAGLGDFVKILP
jgi:hypothetical protein